MLIGMYSSFKIRCWLIRAIFPFQKYLRQQYYVNMKSKRNVKTKNKGSLQKTASTVINIHTHRNSIINESLPLNYNDSMLSIRTSSLLHRNHEAPPQHKYANFNSENRLRKKKLLLRDISHHLQQEKKNSKQNQVKIKKSHFSKEAKVQRRSYIYSQKKKISKKSLAFTQSMLCRNEQDRKDKGLNNLDDLIARNKAILDNYKHYTEQLELDRNKYKEKYREVLLKLRKYEHK